MVCSIESEAEEFLRRDARRFLGGADSFSLTQVGEVDEVEPGSDVSVGGELLDIFSLDKLPKKRLCVVVVQNSLCVLG